ncbi:hypothetical protein CDIK_3700 [Cucumispora dikerogammari]|nr:hypothetical protein CDIK_3700 [Cucumispora dikerogammari]
MTLKNKILQITTLTIIFINNNLQTKEVRIVDRGIFKPYELITSNNTNNLLNFFYNEKIKLNHFRLKNNCYGNSLLFPLYELKDGDGQPISLDSDKTLDFNDVIFKDMFIEIAQNKITGSIEILKENDNLCFIQFDTAKLFIFNRPFTATLHLYLFVTVNDSTRFTVEGPYIKTDGIRINTITIYNITAKKSFIFSFKQKEREKTKRYGLVFPEDLSSMFFKISISDQGVYSLYDSNINNKHATINYIRRKDRNKFS